MTFADRYGPWAVVTGAAQGMGAAFAADLADRGLAVLLVDRSGPALAEQAGRLRAAGAEVAELVVDLVEPAAADQVLAAAAEHDVGLLVSNAAVASTRPFLDQGRPAALAQLEVNCRTPLVLVCGLLPRLVARGRGGVLLMSSLSGLRGTPLEAGYAASKAWNLVFAESLWDEVRDAGVDVMAVLPGPTSTPGFQAAAPQLAEGALVMRPEEVVAEALDALGSGPSFIPGQPNREAQAALAGLDRAAAVRVMGAAMRAMFPADRPGLG